MRHGHPHLRPAGRRSVGFTLLEVMIALLILAVSLAVLMQAQASSLAKAAKARDMTVGTLLARSKMIDIEREVFDEGFTEGEQIEKGDFEDEGYPDIKWQYRLAEVQLDLAMLTGLAEGLGGGEEAGAGLAGEGVEGVVGSLGGMIEPLTQNIANSVRLCELTIEWPEGGKYKNGFTIKTLLTRDGFAFAGNAPAGIPAGAGNGGTEPNGGGVDPNDGGGNPQPGGTPPQPGGVTR